MGKRRVFIIHRWGGAPDKDWIPWLKGEVEKKGIFVKVPQMKDTDAPKIEDWVTHISKLVGDHQKESYLVGHSIGCQAIFRYLATLKKGQTIAGVVFVAPWVHLKNLETEEEKKIAKPWLENKINLGEVKKRADRFVSIFSDNDPCVPLNDAEIFNEKLGSKIITEHSKGHFTSDDGVNELPSALNALLSFMRRGN